MKKFLLTTKQVEVAFMAIANYSFVLGAGRAKTLTGLTVYDEIDALQQLHDRIHAAGAHCVILDADDIKMLKYARSFCEFTKEQEFTFDHLMKTLEVCAADKEYILSRDGKQKGIVKNADSRPCSMEGCTGRRMHVIWQDGAVSYPCTKGCTWLSEHLCKID